MILDRYFRLNMSSSPSRSPIFEEALTGKDDTLPSPIQIKHWQYSTQTKKSASHTSDDDDDVLETSDEQPLSTAFYEINGLYFLFTLNIY